MMEKVTSVKTSQYMQKNVEPSDKSLNFILAYSASVKSIKIRENKKVLLSLN